MKECINHPIDYVEEQEREEEFPKQTLDKLHRDLFAHFDEALEKQKKECNTYLIAFGIVNVGLLILLGLEWGIL